MQIDLSFKNQLRILFTNRHFDKSFMFCLFRGSLPFIAIYTKTKKKKKHFEKKEMMYSVRNSFIYWNIAHGWNDECEINTFMLR